MSPRKKRPVGLDFLDYMLAELIDYAGKNPDSGVGRFLFRVIGAVVLVVVLIAVAVAAAILYGLLGSG